MNRCPAVQSPARMPSISSPTTSAPASSDSRQTIEWSGRTQRKDPDPQRIDLGQGKSRTTRSSTSATISPAFRPGFSTVANQTSPLPVSRASSRSRVSPVARRKPSIAASGASTRGPLRSSLSGGLSARSPSTVSASRRGVAKPAAEA
jgi:hypothetical protein